MFKRVVSIVLAMVMVIGLMPVMQVQAEFEFGNTISAGGSHSMAIKADGSLWTWGSNSYGQLGDGTCEDKLIPTKIMEGVISASAGGDHSMAIKTDGSLWTWGRNENGQLGDGTYEDKLTPEKIMEGVASVTAGDNHSMVIKTDGSLWAWGRNEYGQLGDGTYEDKLTPEKIMEGVASVSTERDHSLAIKTDGSLWVWGRNEYGQLGDGTKGDKLNPVKIMDRVTYVSTGRTHNMAIKVDGSLWTWGLNMYGQLGDETFEDKLIPTKIMEGVISVSTRDDHSMAIKTDGSLWTWGKETHGGYGYSKTRIMDEVVSVSAGYDHSMAIRTDGSLWAWGSNWWGQLGDSTTVSIDEPEKILAGMATTSITITPTPHYIYDTSDPGSLVVLPIEELSAVSDPTSAVSLITSTAEMMTSEQKASATGVDIVTLFAEEAAAQAASKTVEGSGILINQANVQELQSVVASTRTAAESALSTAGIITAREMDASVKFKTAETKSVTITVEPSTANTTADNVRVETPNYAVSLSAESIRANAGDSPLVITITESSSDAIAIAYPIVTASASNRLYGFGLDLTAMAANNGKTYKITFNKPVTENIKVSLPPDSGDNTYQAVIRSDGTAMGGKYNPATGMLDVKIKNSDTYTVKDNKKDFSDIQNKSKEMQQAISVMASKGIINGTSDTTFGPDGTITRAEISALIVRTLSKLDPNANGGFSDVKSNNWYYGAVGSAKKFGIINGTSATTFAPMSNIQKDQIVAVSARTLRAEMKYKNPSDVEKWLGGYTDRSAIPGWGNTDIALATRENLVVKRTDGKFLPAGTMTRGDAAIILYRMFMKIW